MSRHYLGVEREGGVEMKRAFLLKEQLNGMKILGLEEGPWDEESQSEQAGASYTTLRNSSSILGQWD